MSNNTPIHRPLYIPTMEYGSDDAEAISVLVEVDEISVRRLLKVTPFEFVSAHAWVEVVALRSAWGLEPFCGGGIIVPARYKDTIGGFYAFCYIDTDDALALGREPFGYPKKYAKSQVQRTGGAATASIRRKEVHLEVSVKLGEAKVRTSSVPRYPHLLLQVIPSAETIEPLLTRVIARDTSKNSNMTNEEGVAAITIGVGPAGNELGWMRDCVPVMGSYSKGSFRGAMGKVLGTPQIGNELLKELKVIRLNRKPTWLGSIRQRDATAASAGIFQLQVLKLYAWARVLIELAGKFERHTLKYQCSTTFDAMPVMSFA